MTEYNVKVLTSHSELEHIRLDWEQFSNHWINRYDTFNIVCKNRDEVISPYVFCVYENGKLVSLLLARLEDTLFTAKLAYYSLYRKQVKALMIIYNGHIGNTSGEVCDSLLEAINQALVREAADFAFLSHLDITSDFYARVQQQIPAKHKSFSDEQILHWHLELPDTYEALLQRRRPKSRKNIKWERNRLHKEFPDSLEMKIISSTSEMDTLLDDLDQVARQTYQQALGAGFIKNDETREIMETALNQRWLRIYLLYLEGAPAAYSLGYMSGETFFLSSTGYNPKYRDYSIGTFVILSMLEDLCQQPDIHQVDFGFGDAHYKRHFTSYCTEEQSLYIFAGTLRGLKLNLIRSSVVKFGRLAKIIANKLQIIDKIKKKRRQSQI